LAESIVAQSIDILLVDDEPRNLDALEVVLSDPAYRLIRATSADEALRSLLSHDVAAIILDIRMPGLSGFELAQLIKGRRQFQEIPIVFLTAHMLEDQDVIAGYGSGAIDYLTKPVNPKILRHKVGVFADLFVKTRALAELNETLEARVTERTAELESSQAALRVAARQKDEFLATLAHELRNPLAPLRMGLDLLLRAQPPLEHFERTLSAMNRQLSHMVRLIDDLLDVARVSGGNFDLRKEPVDLVRAIQAAIDTSKPFFQQRAQSVSFEPLTSLLVMADSTRLTQVVGNLLHNASKFTPSGGQVTVELGLEAGLALIRVIDPGVGIAPEQLPKIFDMFVRVEGGNGKSGGGLGIGLALSRRLAEMHGGTLTAESRGLNQGSVFTLKIPAENAGAHRVQESTRPPRPAPHNAGLNVVIVEDNVDSAEVLSLWLKGSGYLVTVAHDGPEGLEAIVRMAPRVVLCDIGLPGMDGIEVCRRVRASSLVSKPVMIALTGWGMEQDRRRTEETGFDHHLVKPVDPEILFRLLDSVVPEAT
jgi:signal transduction histidine kinase